MSRAEALRADAVSDSLARALESSDLFALQEWALSASVEELKAVSKWLVEVPWRGRGVLRLLVTVIFQHGTLVPEDLFPLHRIRADFVAPLLRNPTLPPQQLAIVCDEALRRILDPLTETGDLRDIGNALQDLGSGPGFAPEFLGQLVRTLEILHSSLPTNGAPTLRASILKPILFRCRPIPRHLLLRLAKAPVLGPSDTVALLAEFAPGDPEVWRKTFRYASWMVRASLVAAAVERNELMADDDLREAILQQASPEVILAYLPSANADSFARLLIQAAEMNPQLVVEAVTSGKVILPSAMAPSSMARLLSSDREELRAVGFQLLGELHG